MSQKLIMCVPRRLPDRVQPTAVRRAIEENPANAIGARRAVRTPIGRRGGQRRLALLIGRRWPVSGVSLTVKFLDNPSKALRKRILSHMNAWQKTANVHFRETTGSAEVRISRLSEPEEMAGYWSYIGTEILEVDAGMPTMNLQEFTMATLDDEFRRVVRHETGHTLGFEHEHMRSALVKRIDPAKARRYFDLTEGWSPTEVDFQVLTPLKDQSLMGTTEADPDSIMCYQLPGSIMKDGKPIPGGLDINPVDYAFAGAVYPKKVKARKR